MIIVTSSIPEAHRQWHEGIGRWKVPVRYAADLRFLVDRLVFTPTNNARSLIFNDVSSSSAAVRTESSASSLLFSSSSSSSSSSRIKRARVDAVLAPISTNSLESLSLPELEARIATLTTERAAAARDTGGNGKHGALDKRQKYRRIDTQWQYARRILDDVEEDGDDASTTEVEQLFDLFGDALSPYMHVLATEAAPPLPAKKCDRHADVFDLRSVFI